MSENDFWQDGNDDDSETNTMRVLREKAEADSKVIREMAARLQKMEEKESRTALEGSLRTLGFDPKVADLIPKDADPTEWLKTHERLLAKAAADGDATGDTEDAEVPDGLTAEEAAAHAALSSAATGAAPKVGLDAVRTQMDSIQDPDEFIKFLQSQG